MIVSKREPERVCIEQCSGWCAVAREDVEQSKDEAIDDGWWQTTRRSTELMVGPVLACGFLEANNWKG